MSDLGNRIREWDDWVEDDSPNQANDARRPFDAGVMLAVATLFDAWDELDARYVERMDGRVVEAVKGLRESSEAAIE